MRVAARQVGRTLRRAHQIAAPGFGRPTHDRALAYAHLERSAGGWLARRETWPAQLRMVLGGDTLAALQAATLDHPALVCDGRA